MDQDNRRRVQFEGAAHDLTRVRPAPWSIAGVLHLVGDQNIFLVEEENPEFFPIQIGHRRAAIIEHSGKTAHGRAILDGYFGEAFGGFRNDFQLHNRCLAQVLDFAQTFRTGRNHASERAELRDQRFGERFDIAPRDGAK